MGLLLCGFAQLQLLSGLYQKDRDGALNYAGMTWMDEEWYAWNELSDAYQYAATLIRYGSEEDIRSGLLIQVAYDDGRWLTLQESGLLPGGPAGETVEDLGEEPVVSERTAYTAEDYGIEGFYDAVTGEQLAYHYYGNRGSAYGDAVLAVQEQLRQFQNALEQLQSSDVQYQVRAGRHSYGSAPDASLPYRLDYQDGSLTSSIEDYWIDLVYELNYAELRGVTPEVHLATDGAGFALIQLQAAKGRLLLQNFLGMSAVVVSLGLVFLVVLTLGTGRKYPQGKERVYLTPLDTVYLDVLAILLGAGGACLTMIGIWLVEWFNITNFWRHQVAILIITLFLLLPALCIYQCLVRRIKEGGWWRHTLIWHALHNLLWPFRALRRGLGRLFQSWSGMHYKARTVLAILLSWVCILLCLAMPPLIPGLLLVLALVLYSHYRSLGNLERMAQAVEEGEYQPQQTRVGEFAGVARSLGQISQGLDDAVRRRMQSERLKTELITNVSHDLRTPLTSMITYADLLKTEGLDSDKAPEYLEVLIAKTQRLKTLTDELFEAAKAASGSIEVHLSTLDFTQLVRQCMGELDERITGSGLDFRLTLPEAAQVRADGRMLYRMVENLMTNVIKYALPGSRVYLDLAAEDGMWRLELKNISAEPLNVAPEELTERFKRGDDSRHSEGSGLGLSIVQSFAEAQGGSLQVITDGDLFKAVIRLPE